ncbi:MAG: response regulator [Bacteroidota bacterium]|nr:response regulator [Bacteroidota bacterium]
MNKTINQSEAARKLGREADWKDKTILVADDVKINFLLLQAMLGKTKAKILWAHDGVEAINYCKTNRNIDLVLMDFSMPKLNGWEATREIKKIRYDLPVISQTTSRMGTYEFDALASTCDDYILKPLNKENLIYKIGKYINK